MVFKDSEIEEVMIAKYSLLKKYCLAWIKLDTELLKEILDEDISYDAPGVPFDIEGIEHVLEAHKVWFDSLIDENDRNVSPFDKKPNYSCYEVFTQLTPYNSEMIFPYMQLSYFVKDGFYKIYYFDIEINTKSSKITRIHTRHVKFLVNADDYPKYVEAINKNNAFSFNYINK